MPVEELKVAAYGELKIAAYGELKVAAYGELKVAAYGERQRQKPKLSNLTSITKILNRYDDAL